MNIRTLSFKNGDLMHALGLGTWKSSKGEVFEAVKSAIEAGYRHIDCAYIYGNQVEVGEAISACINEEMVKREELWITSKLWNDSHKYEHVLPALEHTLDELKLDYLDLYLIHWPFAFKHGHISPKHSNEFHALHEVPVEETWRGMVGCREKGLAKHIGVSNFSVKKIKQIMAHSEVTPEMNQIEFHPLLQQPQLVSFCKENNIHVTAYSPLGSAKTIDGKGHVLLQYPVIKEMAEQYGCTAAQLILAWELEQGISAIPKSVNPGRIIENWQSQSVQLNSDTIATIRSLDEHYRFVDGTFWTQRDESPYTLEELWDE